jgi:hypothetical protein
MTTNATFVVIFCFSYETKVKDNNERVLSLSSSLFPYIVENNDEPPHSSLSSVIQKKKKHTRTQMKMTRLILIFYNPRKKTSMLVFLRLLETTMNLPAHPHFLVFFLHL